LIEGVLDGTIDVIVSDHQPHDQESKQLEFDLADFGVIGLQTFYPALLKAFGDRAESQLEKITIAPRKILGLEIPMIKEGERANLTLFSPALEWKYNAATNQSKSVASPFINQSLKGKVVGIVNNGNLIQHV